MSHLSTCVQECAKLEWKLERDAIVCDQRALWTTSWHDMRSILIQAYRCTMFQRLAKRREHVYGGLQEISVRQHRALVKQLNPHQTSTLIRVWTGSAMTASHKHRLDPSQPMGCTCGAERQTLQHLMYECPHQKPMPLELSAWQDRPPAQSVAQLYPETRDPETIATWKSACRRAIEVLTNEEQQQQEEEWNGHCVVLNESRDYAYCIHCHIVRRARDYRHIAVRVCAPTQEYACVEGEYMRHKQHCYRLVFKNWKRTVKRPAYHCIACGAWSWATGRLTPRVCALSCLL